VTGGAPPVRVERRPGAVRIHASAYVVEVRANPPRAVLADPAGRIWSQLSLLASLDRTDVRDASYGVGAPDVGEPGEDGAVDVVLTVATPAWEAKEVRLRCSADEVALTATVRGSGTLATATLLGGHAALDSGACGELWSSVEFASVFTPGPTEPVQVVRPSASAVRLGVVGDGGPGRLHGIFSPPPLYLCLGREAPVGATDVPDGAWLSLAARAAPAEATFTELGYDALDAGWRVTLDYDGHTRVAGGFMTPPLVLRPVPDPLTGLATHRRDLVEHGLAPVGPTHPPASWWREPIFSGWGAQCALAPLPGATPRHPRRLDELPAVVLPPGPIAPDLARADVYDALLERLASRGVVPGTVVVDDRWQTAYGTGEPATDRWPDLRAWVAARHDAGQRVLLWWKAWDAAGVPAAECVVDPAGRPVAVDPGNPAYQQRLRGAVTRLLSPDGVGADGLKVDFTQRTPVGAMLRAHSDAPGERSVWGIAALHLLLRTIYEAAKAARPDALVVTHTPAPGFGDVCDMVRTNDVLVRDLGGSVVPPADQLRARVAVVRAALPWHLVDTDQWPMPDRAGWRAYVEAQPGLGVPALYYVDRMDRSDEALTADDLGLVADSWAAYRAALAPEADV